jgi:hypothetical protein
VLEEAARLTLEDLPELATVRAEFIAHIGYHIVINQADEQYLGQGGGNGTLEFMFAQEGMLYMKVRLYYSHLYFSFGSPYICTHLSFNCFLLRLERMLSCAAMTQRLETCRLNTTTS